MARRHHGLTRFTGVCVVPCAAFSLIFGGYLLRSTVGTWDWSPAETAPAAAENGTSPTGEMAPTHLPVSLTYAPVRYFLVPGGEDCVRSELVESEAECSEAVLLLSRSFSGATENKQRPAGCFWEGDAGKSYWNTEPNAQAHLKFAGGVCRSGGPPRTTTTTTLRKITVDDGTEDPLESTPAPPPLLTMDSFLAVEHPPVGVQLPQGWNGPWDAEAAEPTGSFGFIIFADGRRHPAAAVLATVASVRKHYADSPIQVLIDGGDLDFTGACGLAKYFCRSKRLASENSRWNPHSFLKRVHEAASTLQTSHFVLLEPDTLVRGRHEAQPLHDAGGVFENFEAGLHEESRGYLQMRGREANPCFKLRWPRLGLRGAAYFRRAAVLDAFSGKQVMRIDWAGLFRHEGKRALSSEFAMHAALSMQGYTVYPWREVSENWLGPQPATPEARKAWRTNWPAFNEEAAFERGHRESFQAPLPPEEAQLLQSTVQEPEVVCYGCVWYDGPGMEVKRKIKQPDVDNSGNIKAVPSSYKSEDKLVEEKVLAEEYFPEGPSPKDSCHT